MTHQGQYPTEPSPYGSKAAAEQMAAEQAVGGGDRRAQEHADAAKDYAEEFTSTLSAMWHSRPPRIPEDQGGNAKVAGVCEGIAVRYQVDPTLVRTAFVVAALAFGGGIAAYIVAWMCMPRYSKQTSPIEEAFGRRSGTAKSEADLGWGLILLLLITYGMGPLLLDDAATSSSLFTLAVFGTGWYLLHKRKPHPPAGLLAKEQPMDDDGIDMSVFQPVDGYPFPPGRTTPPSWDPLGTVPEAWHLPEPSPRESNDARSARKARRRHRVLWAVVCTILAAGAAVALLFSSFSTTDDLHGFGKTIIAPSSASDLNDRYVFVAEDSELNLTHLNGFEQLADQRNVTVKLGASNLVIHVPKDGSVNVTCPMLFSNTECSASVNSDAKVNVHVEGIAGNVEVKAD